MKLPSKSAIFQARERLGAEPVKALFDRVARPLAVSDAPTAFLAGQRLMFVTNQKPRSTRDGWLG